MNIKKSKLKSNNVPIGDGNNSDKKLTFNTGEADKPYLKFDSAGDSLKFSGTGLTENEIDLASTVSVYIHTQLSALSSWIITHNLNSYPSITVVDSAGTVVIGNYTYDSSNQVTLTFSASFSGKAYLN